MSLRKSLQNELQKLRKYFSQKRLSMSVFRDPIFDFYWLYDQRCSFRFTSIQGWAGKPEIAGKWLREDQRAERQRRHAHGPWLDRPLSALLAG